MSDFVTISALAAMNSSIWARRSIATHGRVILVSTPEQRGAGLQVEAAVSGLGPFVEGQAIGT